MSFVSNYTNHRPLLKQTPNDLFGNQYVGIEFECEDVSKGDCIGEIEKCGWEVKEDGSLRDGGLEFTLGPVMGDRISDGISTFFETIQFVVSPRTGYHIHLDMTQPEDTWEVIRRMYLMYYVFEDLFFTIAGDDRRTMGYSNPIEFNSNDLRNIITASDERRLSYRIFNTSRYDAFNTAALSEHGTIEFRHMPMTMSQPVIISWIKFLLNFKKLCQNTEVEIWDLLSSKEVINNFRAKMVENTQFRDVFFDTDNALRKVMSIKALSSEVVAEDSLSPEQGWWLPHVEAHRRDGQSETWLQGYYGIGYSEPRNQSVDTQAIGSEASEPNRSATFGGQTLEALRAGDYAETNLRSWFGENYYPPEEEVAPPSGFSLGSLSEAEHIEQVTAPRGIYNEYLQNVLSNETRVLAAATAGLEPYFTYGQEDGLIRNGDYDTSTGVEW